MAKNRRKLKYKAQNAIAETAKNVVHPEVLTASNSLEYALNAACLDVGYYGNQSLSAAYPYNNISLDPLSLQFYLLTFLYKTYGILGKIVDIPVDDAYKKGAYDLNADTLDEDEVIELKKTVEREDFKVIKRARKWARLFGGGALIAVSGNSLKDPLRPQELYKQPLQFIAVDRWQLNYSMPSIDIPGGQWILANYNRYNDDNAAIVHPSRIFPVKGKEAPYLIEQYVQGWGISIYEQIFQDMSQFFKGRTVLFELLDEAKTDILKLATLQTALSSDAGMRQLKRMVDFIAREKNYKSMITLPTGDEYDQKQMSFSGLEGIFKEIRIMMAGSANMPVNKLWGEGVTGFGSGEDSLENYNSQIESEIRTPDDPVNDWVLKLRCYQLFGREVEDLTKEWKALRVLSSIDEQNINDHKLSNVLQLFDRQLLTPQETMEYLKKNQIFLHDTKALRGELEGLPLQNNGSEFTEFKDITVE